MFGQLDLHHMFAEQFEPDGANYLYRKNSKDAPIPTSAEERDQFIRAYDKHRSIAIWTMAFLVMMIVMLVVSFDIDVEHSAFSAWLAVASMIVLFFWHRRLWNAPARLLQGRPTAGEARSNAELRRMALVKLSYGQLAFGIGFAVFLLFKLEWKDGWLSAWNVSILIFAVVTVVGFAIQAFRKWRFESSKQ